MRPAADTQALMARVDASRRYARAWVPATAGLATASMRDRSTWSTVPSTPSVLAMACVQPAVEGGLGAGNPHIVGAKPAHVVNFATRRPSEASP